MRGQLLKITEIGVVVVAINPRRMNQLHNRHRTFACAQTAGKHPILASKRDQTDLVRHPIVVDQHCRVIEIVHQGLILREGYKTTKQIEYLARDLAAVVDP